MEFFEDPKYGMGDGGIEYRAIGSKSVVKPDHLAITKVIEVIPYSGTEKESEATASQPTYDTNHQ